jgi:2-oxoglutarate ferredoxin oxidoreductase subunit gamma
MRCEIRISGFGGQGVALAGFILGKAVCLYEGKHAVMTQSYGPEARGGASSSDLVVADRSIDYPFIQQADMLVALSQEAYTKFRSMTKPDALLMIDDGLVKPLGDEAPLALPATALAEDLGRRIVANVVILGFFAAVTDLVSREAMQKSLQTSVRTDFLELNLSAFEAGWEYAKEKERTR